jgi:preprotein translocase subunit SecF
MLKDIRAQLGEIEITRNDAIGPVIGSELRTNALLAIIVAVILMLAYIAFRFKFNYGLASIIAQVFDVMVVISIFSLFRLEINSAFIATILTVVGYSINNTIVIFDRVRENIRKDRSLISGDLINKSIKQTLTRTINTVVAVLILLFCLMILGGETTKIFTFGIIVGVLAGFFSSVFLTGNFLNDLNNRKNKKEQLQKNIQQKNIQNETQAAQKTVKKKKIKSKKVKSVEAKS